MNGDEMKIALLTRRGDSVAPFGKEELGYGVLFPYTNKITGNSDPYIRFDCRPLALVHLSTLEQKDKYDVRLEDDSPFGAVGSVVPLPSLMSFTGR